MICIELCYAKSVCYHPNVPQKVTSFGNFLSSNSDINMGPNLAIILNKRKKMGREPHTHTQGKHHAIMKQKQGRFSDQPRNIKDGSPAEAGTETQNSFPSCQTFQDF